MPHLWLNKGVLGIGAGMAIAGGLGALGGVLGGGGSEGASSISGFEALPKELQDRLLAASKDARQLYNQGAQEYFPGQTFANFDPNQTAGLQSQLDFAQQGLPNQLGQINQSYGNALNAGSIFSDPSVMAGLGTIEDRANRNFSENVLPQLRQQATGTGNQFSSKAEQSERLAGRDLQGMISDAQGSFLGGQLASARGLQGNALGNAPNISQLGLLPGQTQFGVGQAFQGQNQLGISEDVNRFNFNQQAEGQNLNDYIARLTGISGAGGASSQTTNPGTSSNMLGSALGGAILGGGLYNQFSGGGAVQPNFTQPAGANGAGALGINQSQFPSFGGSYGGGF